MRYPHPYLRNPYPITEHQLSHLRKDFPSISPSVWIIGNQDPNYNCFAWVLGEKHNVLLPTNRTTLTKILNEVDYFETSSVATSDVVAYGTGYGSSMRIEHVARYMPVPSLEDQFYWTSKLGESFLITHYLSDLAGLSSNYGDVKLAYESAWSRQKRLASEYNKRFTNLPSYGLSSYEESFIQEVVREIDENFVNQFEVEFTDWCQLVNQPVLLDQSALEKYRNQQSAHGILCLGQMSIPLIIQKAAQPNNWKALYLLEMVLPSSDVCSYDSDDSIRRLAGEQYRAIETVRRWVMRESFDRRRTR
ncbi:MAG: hypothetical protein AAF483_26750 [Planctomycetota bacterium]